MTRLGLTAKFDNQTQVVNVNPVNNINVSVRSPGQMQNKDQVDVSYPPPPDSNIYVTPTEENIKFLLENKCKLENKNEALKIIIEMFKNNPLYINSLLLTDDSKLSQLVKLLTDADEVNIDVTDIGEGCTCGTYEYRKVNAIYVKIGEKTYNLKYDFPDVMKELKDIGINTKIVW